MMAGFRIVAAAGIVAVIYCGFCLTIAQKMCSI